LGRRGTQDSANSARPPSYTSGGVTAVTWIPDARVRNCMACGSGFNMLRRKHHCRSCGQIFCSACSAKTVALPGVLGHAEPVRVCDSCYEKQNSMPHPLTATLGSSV